MASSYSWTITRVFDTDDNRSVGVVGPSGSKMTDASLRAHPAAKRFRLKCDDGESLAEGVYVGPDDESLFGPLDDYGLPNWGCSSIEYRENGRWVPI